MFLQLQQTFLYISQLLLHDYNMKFLKSMCYGVYEHKTTIFFSASKLGYRPLELNSKKFANIWQIEHSCIREMKFEKATF